jgi:quaternary ammonium compound-resistance protein SugE
MNWIILIIAGLFEVAFAFCLGKAKETTGNEMYLWYVGFIVTLTVSMGLLIKATQLYQSVQLMPCGQELEQLELFW